ncbi:AAA family ATPase [Sinorhizobium meliloti]|uniref:AAA family ATPase n=1 Tax=Rhizobium meliloti TaxID=382 RepID=UPI000FD903AC|nr:AAA family ATPase [Sinorhizobium meliloti]MDE3797706.1 AAA family ATPase [Sinorhizobium meliloti]RVI69944.1 AAA family ATPase [Sinorhizobium meliloti]
MSGAASAMDDPVPQGKLRRGQQRQQRKFPLTFLSEIVVDDAEPEFLVDELLPLRGLATIYGAPGSAKTFLAIDLSLSVAGGVPFFGKEVSQGGVVYIAAEAGAGLRKRVIAAREEKAIPPDVAPFAMMARAPNLGPKRSDAATLIGDIQAEWPSDAAPIRLVVVDTLARTLRGDENSAADMGAFVENAAAIAAAFNCLVLVIHHSGKDAERGMRGSSNLNGATDAEWQISSKDGIRTVLLRKMKDGEDGLEWSFRLEKRQLSANSSKPARSTCVVVAETEPKPATAEPRRDPLKGNRKLVWQAVLDALDTYGEIMPACEDLPRCKGVKRKYVKANAVLRGVGNPENPAGQRSVISTELGHLNADNRIRIWNDWIWLPN